MYRHTFFVVMVALLLLPAVASAQTPEPVGTVSTGDNEVARAYDNPNVYFDAVAGVMILGSIHDSEEAASRSASTLARIFVASLVSEVETDYEFGELEEVPVEQVGDEAIAHRMSFMMFGSFEGEYALLAVRQGSWVQLLIGFGVGDVDVLAELEGIASTIAPRWPSDDPIAVREDGLRTGGIWNMVPAPEDLPAGFVVDAEFEEGPPATVSATVPAGTPAVTTDEVEPASEEATPEGRDVPLLPTATADEIQPTEVPETSTEATETPVEAPPSTPAVMNPRLATPFDVDVEIILGDGRYLIDEEDGSCSGTGLLDGLTGGGTLTLNVSSGGQASASTELATSGLVAYDTELQQDVCYFTASFTDVPARAEYALLAGDSVLGRYTYEDLTSGDSLLVVVGGE